MAVRLKTPTELWAEHKRMMFETFRKWLDEQKIPYKLDKHGNLIVLKKEMNNSEEQNITTE